MEKVNEREKQFRKVDSGPKYLFRGPRMEWGVLVLKPQETLGKHHHEEVEETFYFLEGSPIIKINDVPYAVMSGDAYRIEPRESHDIINQTTQNVRAIFIKCPYLPEDKVNC